MPNEMDSPLPSEVQTENPCWQDIYDDDCSMNSVFAASFVAGDWIKSMPCGQGIEDCDMPEEVTLPGVHVKAGVDKVNVMDFLGIKKAAAVDASEQDESS
eukprot:CAMPEP_0116541784 /NCGR_PEP_ID=MMETSP0397-20121206/665_1 /TAXON_ID=216820 /ORGANISM="Cyclophora tenuis, Strain ECT3854" /LENGTH=99 /DNA_ID=CAMNT_0004065745 /DNA_START=199 /DNA_END=498 /DNA_ORIENTATION=+